ncbi:polysaccharide lyase family 1 protein [Cucurbitaria berberidis CBS 394.84]|uniref:Polysaccharide lyase family 1 protein n=1 Tax=Cucurbitaria berberidis CBS 394.84 TaxID=1168544 RepID=A0A9P4GQX9_9PLEO|nr:polysaccharide lyase family 1 protein [Cucurbitaria berberidis CBS 394.84]KAF1849751.1 polysaccharide lyase family 1 protein [Cucurbitaria berberidis CBS 394.84]
MKLSILSVFALALSASAGPAGSGFELVGYGKDNPIGPTTGGAGKDGKTVTVSTVDEFLKAINGSSPTTIYAKGKFNFTARPRVGSNKSLIGVGKGAEITGAGLTIANSTNVIVRNFVIRAIVDNDAITISNSSRVWIDHNEFTSGNFPAAGPDAFDGQVDIIRASDWITVSWNYFHDHWKSSLIGNNDKFRDIDLGHLHVTYHHNYWRNEGTRGPAGRFGHQHIYNNLYEDFLYQAIHSRSDNQVLVEGNIFSGKTREALSTYGLVIPEDSPNTGPNGDYELDGFANLGASKLAFFFCQFLTVCLENDFGKATVNITQVGNFTQAPYKYKLTTLKKLEKVVKKGAGLGKI